jgi:hypothetical protein
MFEAILENEMPSAVFKKLIEMDPSVGNIRIAEILWDEFPDLSGEAQQIVWHWKGPGKEQGLSDANLDALLRPLFVEAGYLSKMS